MKTRTVRWWPGACVLLLGMSLGWAANKTITQVPVTTTHVNRVIIDVRGDSPTVTATYDTVSTTGTRLAESRALAISLTSGQLTTLQTFINNVILPAINVAEGT